MFRVDGLKHYCQDGDAPQTELQIQHSPYGNLIWVLCRNRLADVKSHMKQQGTQIVKKHEEGQSRGTRTWQFQNSPRSSGNGGTVVPTSGQTKTADQWDRAESLESSPLLSQLIFDISAKNILEQSGKNSLSNNWIFT